MVPAVIAPAEIPISAFVLAAPDAGADLRARAAGVVGEAAAAGNGIALQTCHRVELYVLAGRAVDLLPDPWRDALRLDGVDAARHVVGLALGLESAVLGEDQVLHQLRVAVTAARTRGGLAEPLDVLAGHALRAGRTGRSWRPTRSRSLADLAVDRLVACLGALEGRRILVVGAGEMGRLMARAARAAGAAISVASPTLARAEMLAADVRGVALPFDPGAAVRDVDAVVIALSGAWPVATETARALAGCPVVIDLSMPAALERDIVEALGDRLVDVDALAWPSGGTARDSAQDRYRTRLERLREETVVAVGARLAERTAAELAAELSGRVERERAAELAALWRHLPDLPDSERQAIEGMASRLTDRLFRTPLARLARDRDEGSRQLARELFEL